MTFNEKEVREISLSCMGFMVGMFDEINESINSESKWSVEPDYIRNRAIDYLNKLIEEKKSKHE